MGAPSAKPLFRAVSGQSVKDLPLMPEAPVQNAPSAGRDVLDFDPTPPSATEAFLAVEKPFIQAHGTHVWETAVGGGHIAHVLERHGFNVTGTDVEHRGWPDVRLRSFFDHSEALARSRLPTRPIVRSTPPTGMGAGSGMVRR